MFDMSPIKDAIDKQNSDPVHTARMQLVRQYNIEGISENIFRNVLVGASAAYSVHKRVPSVEEIHEYCNAAPRSISKVISTPEFKTTMIQRGYAWDNSKLTPEQHFAVGIITDPSRRGDLRSKCGAAGISYSQWASWMKQPHFKDFVNKVGEDMLGENIATVHAAVVNKATSGDIGAAKLVYELTGRYDPARQQTLDLQNVIALLLEVITRHVRDTTILSAITDDVAIVMSGKTPKTLTTFSFAEDMNDVIDAEVVGYDTLAEPVNTDSAGAPVGKDFFDFDSD